MRRGDVFTITERGGDFTGKPRPAVIIQSDFFSALASVTVYAFVGTLDTVLRSIETMQRRQKVDWVFAYTYNALVPHAVLMKSIEAFHAKVLPRVS